MAGNRGYRCCPGFLLQQTLILLLAWRSAPRHHGTATAWLVLMCRFPSRDAPFEWALALPLAVPS